MLFLVHLVLLMYWIIENVSPIPQTKAKVTMSLVSNKENFEHLDISVIKMS